MEFLKELAVGLKTAKSYPSTHPAMAKIISSTMSHITKLNADYPEFSIYFLEQTIIFQDLRIDAAKNIALVALMESLKKNEINSLTFSTGAAQEDLKNIYEVMSAAKLKIKEYGDAATMLTAKGTERIKINAVKFGVQGGQASVEITTKAAPEVTAALKTEENFIIEIKNLKGLIDQGVSHLMVKDNLLKASDLLSQAPPESMNTHSEMVAKILEQLPSEQRIEILRDIELKPFVLKLFSHLDDETLLKLITARTGDQNSVDLSKIIGSIGDAKLSTILPELKQIIPNIYEYLAQVGLLLSEKLTSVISKDELRISLSPYYNMLDNPNSHLREEGLKSLLTLAKRFVAQKYNDLTEEVAARIAVALENEAVEEVIIKTISPLFDFYNACMAAELHRSAATVLEPFNKILGRSGLSQNFKKMCINFLGETQSQVILPTLFTFLWETGIYPEVRAALIKYGKDAIPEALSTLKEAEDYSFRTKLVDIIKNVGKDGIDILINALGTDEWFIKRNILAILGEIGDPGVLPRIIHLLSDPDDRVRIELVHTLTKFENEEGLFDALNDVSMEVKAEALKGLRKKITPAKVNELIPLLKEKGDALHTELLKILGERKIVEAGKEIAQYLRTLENREDAPAQALKELSVTTMVRLNFPELKDRLEEFNLTKDKNLAALIASALKRIAG